MSEEKKKYQEKEYIINCEKKSDATILMSVLDELYGGGHKLVDIGWDMKRKIGITLTEM